MYVLKDGELLMDNKNLVIPSEINGETIRKITPDLFRDNNSIDTVVIKKNTRIIGENAFRECDIKQVVIGDDVEIIEHDAFYKSNIKVVVFGIKIKEIRKCSFERNNITHLILPDTLDTIEERGFYNNDIQSISICGNVELHSNDYSAFNNGFDEVYNGNKRKPGTYFKKEYSDWDYFPFRLKKMVIE